MNVIDPNDIDPIDYPKGPNGHPLWVIEWDGPDGLLYGDQIEAATLEDAMAQLKEGQRLLGQLALAVDVDASGGSA